MVAAGQMLLSAPTTADTAPQFVFGSSVLKMDQPLFSSKSYHNNTKTNKLSTEVKLWRSKAQNWIKKCIKRAPINLLLENGNIMPPVQNCQESIVYPNSPTEQGGHFSEEQPRGQK